MCSEIDARVACQEEFLQQGDAERDQWGRVSPLMDRNLPSVCHPLNQIGFQVLFEGIVGRC